MTVNMTAKKILTIFLCILIVAGLALARHIDQKQQQEMQDRYARLDELAAPYQAELETLKKELAALQKELQYTPTAARFMMGFFAADAADMAYIEQKAEAYSFDPVVVVDCGSGLEAARAAINAANPSWEIMLYSYELSDQSYETIRAAKEYLKSIEREDVGVFLLGSWNGSEANIRRLKEEGFVGYTSYRDPPAAGQNEDGTVYFDYAFVKKSNEGFNSRISSIYGNSASTIFIFDVPKINAGAMSEEMAIYYFETIQRYAAMENCMLATASEVIQELSAINELLEQKQVENNAQITQLTQRIKELNRMISDIYEQ